MANEAAIDKIYEELCSQIRDQTVGTLFDDLMPQAYCKIARCDTNPNQVMFLGFINLDRLRSVAGVSAIEEITAPVRRYNEAMAEAERQVDARIIDMLRQNYTHGEIAKSVGVGPAVVSRVFGRERDKALASCKPISGFESYVMGIDGKIFSFRRNKEVKPTVVNGSTYVQLFKDNGGYKRRVSDLLHATWGVARKCATPKCDANLSGKSDRVTHCFECKAKQLHTKNQLAVKLARSHGFDAELKDATHWKRWAESLGINFSELLKETENA